MIKKIELKDFKTHGLTQLDVGRLTLLVGPNNSGKTSCLEAVLLLCQVGSSSAKKVLEGENDPGVLSRNRQRAFAIGFQGRFLSKPFVISLDRTRTTQEYSYSVFYDGKQRDPFQTVSGDVVYSLLEALRRTIHLKLSPRRLAARSYSEDIPPRVGDVGEGLASALAYLMTYEPDRFHILMDLVQSVLPNVKAIRIQPARVKLSSRSLSAAGDTAPLVVGHEMVLDIDEAREIPAHAVSDGTLLAIGLLTILAGSSCPDLVLVDDIERGLHPQAQRRLIDVLKEILEERPELQIILTTHSPYVVDKLDASDVWVLAADPAGDTTARRLADHADAEKALKVLMAGELPDAEGESWRAKP